MKNKELARTIKFVLFSASAGVIEFVSFTLLSEVFHLPYWPSHVISLVLSVIWNFTFNRKFTFKSAANVPKAMAMAFLFYLFFTPLSTIGGNYLVETLHWNEFLVKIMTMACNMILEYLWDRFVVFRNSIDSAEGAGDKAEDDTTEADKSEA